MASAPRPPELPGFLRAADAAERARFAASAFPVSVPAGKQVLVWNQAPPAIAFPVKGRIRVMLSSAEGREITLYRVEPGGACVLTASCILGGAGFPATAVVEEDTRGWMVPAPTFRDWVSRSPFWRDFVFRLLGDRLAHVLGRMEELTFDSIDRRLARRLLTESVPWSGTHQELAEDTGTAREVVSRVLKRWRGHGWIRSSRGSVEIRRRAALEALAAGTVPR